MTKLQHKAIALGINHLSKSFRLPTEKPSGLKQSLINLSKGVKGYTEQTVLQDISFTVHKGDFFGIVGRNGSGKSTLLKLISGIYTANAGTITIDGSLVAFIELGVGFQGELSGRENVYLNGALMGLSVSEIDAIYDDIVNFAELHDFMGQKLKNYSSGMQVRLAFSCAIQANSDILVLDEVLAVGDEAFQRKCNEYFTKVKEDANKTVILVTHSMESVRKYCNRALLINDGVIQIAGEPDDVASQYTLDNLSSNQNHSQNGSIYIKSVSDLQLKSEENLVFDVFYETLNDEPAHVGMSIWCGDTAIYTDSMRPHPTTQKGKYSLRYTYPLHGLGNAFLKVSASLYQTLPNESPLLAYTDSSNTLYVEVKNSEAIGALANHGQWGVPVKI